MAYWSVWSSKVRTQFAWGTGVPVVQVARFGRNRVYGPLDGGFRSQ